MIISGIQVELLPDRLKWSGGLAIDADGAAECYHPSAGKGLDSLANAYHDPNEKPVDRMKPSSGWAGVALDEHGQPVVQGQHDVAPGYLVATTALQNPAYPVRDPRRYVNSLRVPFLSISTGLRHLGARIGDVGAARYRGGPWAPAIVADVGPGICEGSMALARALGVSDNPRHGGTGHGVDFIVWPRSAASPPWPRSVEEIAAQVAGLLR